MRQFLDLSVELTMDRETRSSILGFKPQKEIVYNKLLPYAQQLDDQSQRMLLEIKTNLGLSVMMREMRPGCGMWTARLKQYIKLYGLKFSKEDHLRFIHLMYELVTIPNLEPYLVSKFGHVLVTLLKKKELISPEELVLPWRPLYELCKRIFSSSRGAIGMYRYFSYFPASATEEMLNEWRPLLCPFDNTKIVSTIETLEWFLPIALPPSRSDKGYKLWFNDFMNLWDVCNNTPSWEADMMWLMARLARCNIGYIDWEPYVPLIFTRLLRSLNLPVSYKQIHNSKNHKLETAAMALWIVSVLGGGSSAQKHLDKFMMTLESYFHPANFGRWVLKLSELLSKLPLYFVQRLNFERYKKLTWETPVPESHKLTEDDITRFVLSVKPVAMQAMFSKMGLEVSQAMQHLATLRPQLIIPEIVESVYANLETVVQPHKFQAALQCLIAVIRPMAEGGRTDFKEGPTHVIPMLLSVLPGIDPNDIRKCFVSLHFISTVANMVPIIDCSKASEYHSNLTEEEESICLATSNFEDFVLQFLDRCFVLVESSSLESTRLEREADRRSRMENLAENALASTCIALLTQTSPQIFKAALRKLHSFVMGRILETKVAGQFMAAMCRSFSKVNGEETLRMFVPCLSDNILTLTDSEDILKEETLDNELLYNLVVLSEIVDCPGKFLLPHVPTLKKVLDRTLHLTCREGHTIAARLMHLTLNSLCSTVPLEFRSVPQTFAEDIKDYLPVRDWGKAGNIHDLRVNWYIPGKEEINCVKSFIDSYLCPEMNSIEQFIADTSSMSKEELQRSLGIIWAFLGCRVPLPQWEEAPLELAKSCLSDSPFQSKTELDYERSKDHGITVNNMNVKKAIVALMDKLQVKLLECKEDDTKSFFVLINIWECLLTDVRDERLAFEARWKRFRIVKRILENKLVGEKRHLRALLIDRAVLQHEVLLERGNFCITPTHKLIMLNLLTLSTSQYSEVRARAQGKLFTAMDIFPYSYVILIPKLLENLKKNTLIEHEQFKGALYVLLGRKQNPVVARHDWYVLNSLWPAIVRAHPSEKISVIRLLENLVDVVHKQFPTITINLEIPDSCEAAGQDLWASVPRESHDFATKDLIEEGKKQLILKNQYNLEQYLSLLHSLNNAIENENLHWRFHSMALSFLRDLVHPDVAYPPAVVKCFLNTLVNDSIELRKIAIRSVIFLLKQQKRTQKVVKVNPYNVDGVIVEKPSNICPGDRPDNQWVQYRTPQLPNSAEEWNKPRYAHRPYHGFYAWPDELELYEQTLDPPPLMGDALNDKEKEVKAFFSKSHNVERLMNFLTLEEKKGKDKFNGYKFLMFKGLFRNGGYEMFKIFMPHLEALVSSKLESHQRCAAEIIAGAVRGAKHWPYEMVRDLWKFLTPLIRSALVNMTEETIIDWGVCFATASENVDPRRNHWLFEVLMEEPGRNESSFTECGRLYSLQGALNQQLWRMAELLNLWFERLRPYLSHPFQNVRERMGSVLNNIFECDLRFPGGNPPQSPLISNFIDYVMPQLTLLYSICAEAVDKPENLLNKNVKLSSLNHIVSLKADVGAQGDQAKLEAVEKVEDPAIRLLKTGVTKFFLASSSYLYGISSSVGF
ncbi:Proteasome activator complex subunit 4 [Gryllus bimaculatus]|nr:Proteasome activator complex subunit 4 [Gryllus bimaculatus]